MRELPTLPMMLKKLQQPGMLRSLAWGAGTAFVIQVMGVGLGYLLQVVLARLMGPGEYGLYIYVLAWASIVQIVAVLGLPGAVLRFIPLYKTQGDPARLQGVIRGTWQIALGSSLAWSLLGTVVVLSINAYREVPNLTPILLGVWIIPLLALEDLQLSVFRADRQMVSAYAPSRVMRPLLLIGGAFAFFLLQGNQILSSTTVLILMMLVMVTVLGSQRWLLQRGLLAQGKGNRPIYERREWLRVSIPLLLITGFIVILYQTDLLLIGAFLDSTQVGLYNAAAKTANLGSFIFGAVEAIAAPMIASLHAEGNRKDLQKLMSTMAHLIFWPSLAVTLFLIAFSQQILGLFGSEFAAARWVLIALALGQLVNAATGPVGYLMDLTGHQDQSARVRFSTAVINIVLNSICIPLFGIVGAAIATAIAVSIDNLRIYFLAVKNVGIHASIFSCWTLPASPRK